MLQVSVWGHKVKDTNKFPQKEWHEEVLPDSPQWFKEVEK